MCLEQLVEEARHFFRPHLLPVQLRQQELLLPPVGLCRRRLGRHLTRRNRNGTGTGKQKCSTKMFDKNGRKIVEKWLTKMSIKKGRKTVEPK